MSSKIYGKLAVTNLRNNRKTYIPYFITATLTIMMYFMMANLSQSSKIGESLSVILNMGTGIISIFSVILLFYTNSFLIKRRQKEIGVYNILGMEKRHIGKMLALETLIVGGASIIIGLICGLVISRLMYMILRKILVYNINFDFELSIQALLATVILFVIIFFVTLVYNLIQIKLSNPIELLHGSNEGEKEPKSRLLLTLVGVLLLGIGYYIAITTKSPLSALTLFFVAVLCVILGTYALFTAGSITLLKILKKNKKFYYKTNHFTAVSGLLYRMKQNAIGLANICILSTAMLVMVSTTFSLYIGMQDELDLRFTRTFNYTVTGGNKESVTKANNIIAEQAKKNQLTMDDDVAYESKTDMGVMKNNDFVSGEEGAKFADLVFIAYLDEEQYNKLEGKNEELKENEILVYASDPHYNEKELTINGQKFSILKQIDPLSMAGEANSIVKSFVVICKDKETIMNITNQEGFSYTRGFNFVGNKEKIKAAEKEIQNEIVDGVENTRTDIRSTVESSFFELYGSLFFIGIYLGLMFLMATVLIIYYKQISEGFDDKKRYQIMQKVGMSKKEVKDSIKSQVLIVFFFPLVMAIIHVAAAFPMITRLLAIFNLTNITLFAITTLVTILVFVIIYIIVYSVTAKEYYNIVN